MNFFLERMSEVPKLLLILSLALIPLLNGCSEDVVRSAQPTTSIIKQPTPVLTPFATRPPQPTATPVPSVPGSTVPDEQGHYYKGNPSAKVILEEWSDIQCPACASIQPLVNRVIYTYQDSIKVVYRHNPLVRIHPLAFEAAEVCEAAGEQGAFWPMLEGLLAEQRSLGSSLYRKKATELGLDVERFVTALESRRFREKVDMDLNDAMRLGITSTPTFLLNGKQLMIRSAQDLDTAVRNEILAQRSLMPQ
jgi:protein-disulfide isomerase